MILDEMVKVRLDSYFYTLINVQDLDYIKEQMLPTLLLNRTNLIIDLLIKKMSEELELAIEAEMHEYKEYLEKVIEIFKESKVKQEESKKTQTLERKFKLDENVLIFAPCFYRALKKIKEKDTVLKIIHSIENLKTKELTNSVISTKNYKQLHGDANYLSEVKCDEIRLLYSKINADFICVVGIIQKKSNTDKRYRENLKILSDTAEKYVEHLIERFTINGELDYEALINYSINSGQEVYEYLGNWEVNKSNGRI